MMHGCVGIGAGLFILAVLLDKSDSYILKKSKDMKTITSSSLQLKYCSTDSTVVGYRAMSMNNNKGCPQGTRYLCGNDSTDSFLIESCEAILVCLPGTSHQFEVDLLHMTFELKCLPCNPGRFEPEQSNSSQFSRLLGCTYPHIPSKHISKNLVLFRQGTASKPTLWYCDNENGYYEEDGNMFCGDLKTKPCNCVQKTCKTDNLLSPNGSCVKCNTKLDPYNNFKCQQENRNNKLSHRTGRPHQSENDDFQQKNLDDRKDGDASSPFTARTTSAKRPADAANSWLIVGIVAVVALGVAVSAGILWRHHNCSLFHMAAAVRFSLNMVARRCNRAPRTDAGLPTVSNAEQAVFEEPLPDNNHTTNPNDVQVEHQSMQTVNHQTVNNFYTYNGDIVMNGPIDMDNQYRQPEGNIPPPSYSARYENSAQRLEILKPNDEGSVEADLFDRSESFEREPLDSGVNTMEYTRQQQGHQDIEEDVDDGAVENFSLLSGQNSDSQTYPKQRLDES